MALPTESLKKVEISWLILYFLNVLELIKNAKRIPNVILTKTPTSVSQIVVLNRTLINSGSKKSAI